MNSKQHRSTYRQVDQIDRKIMKQIQSLRQLQKFSSRVSTKTPTTSNYPYKPPPSSSKILQIKPSSKGQKSYTISEVKIGHTTKPKNKYQDIETTKNKENNPRNPMNDLTEYHKKKQVGYGKVQKHASGGKGKEHLKTEMSTKQDEDVGYFGNNRNHYVSANLMNQNLFQNYDLSDSEGEEGELFPEDSLNFSLKEEVPRERNWNGGSRQGKEGKRLKQDFLDLLEIEGYSQTNPNNIKPQSRTKRRDNERAAECTFKPTILDKSKQIAERLGSSYTRLTKSKNPTKQNTYRQNPTKSKTYSKQRLNTLSKPRPIPTETQQQITDQCTFKPVLSKKSLNHFNGCYLDITERSTLWQNQRRQKIEKIRESNEQMKNDKMRMECSAVKIRNNYNPNQQVAFSRFGKDGLIQYFERVNQVNEIKKRDKEMESKFSGKGWNGSITKPQEFKLSSNSTNELSYRSREKSVTVNSVGANNHSEKQYEKAVKQVHDKIRQLNLMI